MIQINIHGLFKSIMGIFKSTTRNSLPYKTFNSLKKLFRETQIQKTLKLSIEISMGYFNFLSTVTPDVCSVERSPKFVFRV